MAERSVLLLVSHPFLLKLFAKFQDRTHVHLLTDAALGGDLFSLIEAFPHGMPDDRASFYAANVACALMALHDLRIVHRDLKPENLILNADGYLKLIDYGISKLVDSHTFTVCGTPGFMAPEMISQRGHNTAADWWALGALIFEMLTNSPAFDSPSLGGPLEVYSAILAGRYAFPRPPSEAATSIVARLLVVSPQQRLNGVKEFTSQPFFDSINFVQLEQRVTPPPFLPTIRDGTDLSNIVAEEKVLCGMRPSEWAQREQECIDLFSGF